MELEQHPTVREFRKKAPAEPAALAPLDAAWLRQLCLEAGADDAGFVEIERPELAGERKEILDRFPGARTLISFVCRMNRQNVQSPARSLANLEFHHSTEGVDEVGRRIVAALERRGLRAMNAAAAGFPMEAERWGTGRTWLVAHKPVAVAAGLGQMGIHRNVIHPRFGNFITLGTVVTEAAVTATSRPLDYNPCLECKLCVAACPTGAIAPDGQFNFAACYTHNYREFMGGFSDFVETIAESGSRRAYREKVTDAETFSWWQSLSFGPNYKAAYCMAVCPAGEDVIAPFLTQRKQYLDEVVRPLQQKPETIYVVAGSDAESYVPRRFPWKKTKRISNGLRSRSVGSFLRGLPWVFQREQSKGIDTTFHFSFTGAEERQATVVIRKQTLTVLDGHVGKPDLVLTADAATWLRFLAREIGLLGVLGALLRGKIRLRGSPLLLRAFARCFPS